MRDQRALDNNQEKIVNAFIVRYFFNKTFLQVEEVSDKKRQCAGIDIVADGLNIDIKAQSSKNYVNNPRPTFILELSFLNSYREETLGWFINPDSLTDVYAFVWIPKAFVVKGRIPSVESIEEIEIMLVDKHKLKSYINKSYTDNDLLDLSEHMRRTCTTRLPSKILGVHFSHTPTLFEQPSNIVAQKEFLKQFAIRHCMVTPTTITDIT